ncbi:MAG: putative manganese-dependent inorganic diphosphatase [Lachnospiraceae bacterium]|nr:putative manganese-dependent inorganic diphosphatase [Lachnospiraceae bacterium]
MESSKENKIFVIGHKNPDTDSICSAIAYTKLKQTLSGDKKYIAKRAGLLNAETEYVLNRFEVEEPTLLSNVRLQVRDVDVNRIAGIQADTSIRDAWAIMKEQKVYTIAITEADKLKGVITTNDIAMSYMDVYDNRILSTARTQYKNIVNAVDGEALTGDVESYFTEGKVVVAASSPDVMESIIEKGDLVILGNRYEVQLCAIELEASCIIVCGQDKVTRTIKKLAEERNIIMITTPHDTFTTGRLVNQSIPVEHFMRKEGLTIFKDTDFVEEIKKDMTKDRSWDFPVIDKKGNFYGFISSRRLMDASKKQVILVDHNEKTQAVDGIDEADILEIIDHHRLGGLETVGPVYFRNQPVGCTATIIYTMYRENQVELDKTTAALLCAAIISDTLLFRSPTATIVDEMVAKELAGIAELDMEELAHNMFRAGSDLKGKAAEEICFQDFKQFTVGNVKFGVGQINSMNKDELQEIKEVLYPYLEKAAEIHNLDMVFFMLTDIVEASTELLHYGKGAKDQVIEAYDLPADTEVIELNGVVSRKKQFIPTFVVSLQK